MGRREGDQFQWPSDISTKCVHSCDAIVYGGSELTFPSLRFGLGEVPVGTGRGTSQTTKRHVEKYREDVTVGCVYSKRKNELLKDSDSRKIETANKVPGVSVNQWHKHHLLTGLFLSNLI